MLVFQYVISNTGSLIWPSALPVNQNLNTIPNNLKNKGIKTWHQVT